MSCNLFCSWFYCCKLLNLRYVLNFIFLFFRQRNMLQNRSSLFSIHLNQVTLLSMKNRKDV